MAQAGSRSRPWLAALLVAGGAFATCGHGGGGCGGDDDHGGEEEEQFICDGDEDPYEAGLIKVGAGGVFKLETLEFVPNPHVVEQSMMRVRLLDASDQPVAGAEFTRVEPITAKHDHGTPVVPTVTDDGGGEYTIDDLAYVHRGPWDIFIDVSAGGMTDSLQFTFCVVDPAFEEEGGQ